MFKARTKGRKARSIERGTSDDEAPWPTSDGREPDPIRALSRPRDTVLRIIGAVAVVATDKLGQTTRHVVEVGSPDQRFENDDGVDANIQNGKEDRQDVGLGPNDMQLLHLRERKEWHILIRELLRKVLCKRHPKDLQLQPHFSKKREKLGALHLKSAQLEVRRRIAAKELKGYVALSEGDGSKCGYLVLEEQVEDESTNVEPRGFEGCRRRRFLGRPVGNPSKVHDDPLERPE
jgi:hypothetical protein